MSIDSKTGAASSAIRQRLADFPWRSQGSYSPVFSIALLLIVGLAVKISH
jgi:hypothetical protein